MSGDPLLLPEIWSDLPNGGAAESARAEFATTGRAGVVLIDYVERFARNDSPALVGPLDRAAEASAGGQVQAPSALAKGLADLAAIVTQAEALLRAQGTLKGDVYFAVERIHDVALALRMRDVNAALCDTLEASVREVGDAVVRHEAAATGALSAAALLVDIMHRIRELTRIVDAGAEPVAGRSPPAADVAPVAAPPAAAAASVVFKTESVEQNPVPVATEAERPPEVLAVTSQAQAAIEQLPTAAALPVERAAERPSGMADRPLAYFAPAPPADRPLAVADSVAADGAPPGDAVSADTTFDPLASEAPVPAGAAEDLISADAWPNDVTSAELMSQESASVAARSEPATSDGVASVDAAADAMIADAAHVSAWRDAMPDEFSATDETLREPAAIACEGLTVAAEQPLPAAYLPDRIDGVAATLAAASVPPDRIAAAANVDAVPPDAIAADMIPVEGMPPEGLSSPTDAAGMQAPEIADAQDAATSEPQPVDDPAASVQAKAGESDSNALVRKGAAVDTAVRRPASDPLAAFYGLSEEELIALFS